MRNPDRPRLPLEWEEKFVPVDQRNAEVYAAMEKAGGRLDALVADLRDGVVGEELDLGDTAVRQIESAAAPKV